MKNKLTLLFFFFNALLVAQTQDLLKLASGEYLSFNAIFDTKANLFGYFSLYGYGKTSDKTKKFEYVLLDKNLNPIANNVFESDITTLDYFASMDFKGNILLNPRIDYSAVREKDLFSPSVMQITLKTNTIEKKKYFDYKQDGTFEELNTSQKWKDEKKDDKSEKRELGYNFISGVYEIKEGGFLVLQYKDYGKYTNGNVLSRFDEKKNKLWDYAYNSQGTKKVYESLVLLDKDNKHAYCVLVSTNKKDIKYYVVVIDMNTGKELKRVPLTGLNVDTLQYLLYFNNIENEKKFDDKIVIVCNLREDYYLFDWSKRGFARLIIDKKTFEVKEDVLSYENDLEKFIPKLDKRGFVERNLMLAPRDLFFLKDGSVGILMEKFRPESSNLRAKSTDLVYIQTDSNFKVKEVQVFEKEKTKGYPSDYLFSQYLNNGNDLVFFYKDLQKEDGQKNWNLFINTQIKGVLKQEKIQISQKDKFVVYPYVAKEGYILLREFNTKEKYNKVRLERLNF